ncbi:MAG: hypothetical protein ACREJQ_05455 [bacterium]
MHKLTSNQAKVAFLSFENYVNGAVIQWHRIQESKTRLPGPGPGVDPILIWTLFLDIHFFFICGDKVQNLLDCLAKSDGTHDLQNFWDNWKSRLKPFNDARNHLEHLDSRITSPKDYLSDFGNLHGDTYSFGGESYDVSIGALIMLTAVYEEVIRLLDARP